MTTHPYHTGVKLVEFPIVDFGGCWAAGPGAWLMTDLETSDQPKPLTPPPPAYPITPPDQKTKIPKGGLERPEEDKNE